MDEWEHWKLYADSRLDGHAAVVAARLDDIGRRIDRLDADAERRGDTLRAAFETLAIEQTKFVTVVDFNGYVRRADEERSARSRQAVGTAVAILIALLTSAAAILAAIIH